MRRAGEKLAEGQAQSLSSTYYFALPNGRQKDRQALLEAVPPDDHISTLKWAFDNDPHSSESQQRIIRYYTALLDAAAGRREKAIADLRALQREIGGDAGSLRDAVQQSLQRLEAAERTRR